MQRYAPRHEEEAHGHHGTHHRREHGWAFGGPLLDFAALGYSSEEFFLEGTASRYQPMDGTTLDRDGKWDVEPCESAAVQDPVRRLPAA